MYVDNLIEWLKDCCIVETEDNVFYDGFTTDREQKDLFISNIRALSVDEENEAIEALKFETSQELEDYLLNDETCMFQKMIDAAWFTFRDEHIDDDSDAYVDIQLWHIDDCREVHVEIETDVDV